MSSTTSPKLGWWGWWAKRDSGLLVFAGGAVGTLLRAGLGVLLPAVPGQLPVATVTVNLVGAFVLGWLTVAVTRGVRDPDRARRLRLGLGTGLCGGFTTFSTFMVESVHLLGEAPGIAVGYLAVSLVGGVLAAAGGAWLGSAGPPRGSAGLPGAGQGAGSDQPQAGGGR